MTAIDTRKAEHYLLPRQPGQPRLFHQDDNLQLEKYDYYIERRGNILLRY
jgi:hypothetical protein